MLCKIGELSRADRVLQAKDDRCDSTWTIAGVAQVDDDKIEVAFKAVDHKRLANEIVASWLGRKIGWSSVADAMLLSDQAGRVAQLVGSQYPGQRFLRGLGTPLSTIKPTPRTDYSDRVKMTGVADFQQLIVFDTLIANVDRMDRNLLGAGPFFVFDHDQAFTGLSWTADTLLQAQNRVLDSTFDQNLMFATSQTVNAVRTTATKWSARLTTIDLDELDELVPLGVLACDEVAALKGFVQFRASALSELVDRVIQKNTS